MRSQNARVHRNSVSSSRNYANSFHTSSGNCKVGLYCDSQQLVCVQGKDVGETCDADKECLSYNCLADGTCGVTTDTPVKVKTWVYIVVGICIIGGKQSL